MPTADRRRPRHCCAPRLGLLHTDDPQGDLLAAALSEAYLAAGDVPGATATLVGRRADPPRTALPRGRAQLARCAGLVAAASGDPTTAVRRLAEALAAFERHDLPFEAARTRLDLARTVAADRSRRPLPATPRGRCAT